MSRTMPRGGRAAAVVIVLIVMLWAPAVASARGGIISRLSMAPATFSPNGDGYLDKTSVRFRTTRTAKVRVQIRTSRGRLLKTLKDWTSMRSGAHKVVWNGRYRDGRGVVRTAADGRYRVVVQASTSRAAARRATEVTVNKTLRSVAASPQPFYGGAGSLGRATLRYSLTRPAIVTVVVSRPGGGVVRVLTPPTAARAGTFTARWDGVGDGGAELPEGSYQLMVSAANAVGTVRVTRAVSFQLMPVASEASLCLHADGRQAIHGVIEQWDETLHGQTSAGYYADGRSQPWEWAAQSGASLTLYVGSSATDRKDTTSGGAATGISDARGVVDLAIPDGLSRYDPLGRLLPLYYSLKLTYGSGTRWYPADGRHPLRPPTGPDGHITFTYASDIQTPRNAPPTPGVQPAGLTSAAGLHQPYTAIPRLSRGLGWAAVLAGLRSETGSNLALFGGDETQQMDDSSAPDSGATQLRSLLDNRQAGVGEWSLSSLAGIVPTVLAAGNHEAIDSSTVAALWDRWAYSPTGRPYFAFDLGDVHFVVLDMFDAGTDPATDYTGWIGLQSLVRGGSRTVTVGGVTSTLENSAQADWLIGALNTAKPWTVVLAHYPIYDSATTSPYAQADQSGPVTAANTYYYGERDRLATLLAARGVDLVLQGHLHYFRRHMETVCSQDGSLTVAQTFLTDGQAGAETVNYQKDAVDNELTFIDWVDLNGNGVPDVDEPSRSETDTYWDASYFGRRDSVPTASGYFGQPDLYHPTGEEYDDGLTFSYCVLQTGQDGAGAPTLTLTVKRIRWDRATHSWDPWTVAESVAVPQVPAGMAPARLQP